MCCDYQGSCSSLVDALVDLNRMGFFTAPRLLSDVGISGSRAIFWIAKDELLHPDREGTFRFSHPPTGGSVQLSSFL